MAFGAVEDEATKNEENQGGKRLQARYCEACLARDQGMHKLSDSHARSVVKHWVDGCKALMIMRMSQNHAARATIPSPRAFSAAFGLSDFELLLLEIKRNLEVDRV